MLVFNLFISYNCILNITELYNPVYLNLSGFLISFGMQTNLGVAIIEKMKENPVSLVCNAFQIQIAVDSDYFCIYICQVISYLFLETGIWLGFLKPRTHSKFIFLGLPCHSNSWRSSSFEVSGKFVRYLTNSYSGRTMCILDIES